MAIFSVQKSDLSILESISKIYLKNEFFDYDPTYSMGNFYPNKQPKIKSDIKYNYGLDMICDFRSISLINNCLNSILIDPPFLITYKDKIKNRHCTLDRFSFYNRERDLLSHYFQILCECHRILKRKGILVFKCQDMTNNKFFGTHFELYNQAKTLNFECLDLFIKHNKSKIYNPNLKQLHALKTHSYYFVFKKK